MRKFHFSSICNVLPCKLRLFWYSTRVLNRHLANKLPTCGQQSADSRPTNGQQSADCWQKIFVRGGKRQSADSWPTIGQQLADCRSTVVRLLANCWPTVGRLLADCWPTVSRQFFGGAVLHFFLGMTVLIQDFFVRISRCRYFVFIFGLCFDIAHVFIV